MSYMKVQQALIDQMAGIPKLTRTQVQRKIQLCKNIIDCLSKVESGIKIRISPKRIVKENVL